MTLTDAFMSLKKVLDTVRTRYPRIEYYSKYVVILGGINEEKQQGKDNKTEQQHDCK